MDHGIVSQPQPQSRRAPIRGHCLWRDAPRWEGLLEVISASMEEMKVEPERHPVLLTEVR